MTTPTHQICVLCSTAVPTSWTWRRHDEKPVCVSCVADAGESTDYLEDRDMVLISHDIFHRRLGFFAAWCYYCRAGGDPVSA